MAQPLSAIKLRVKLRLGWLLLKSWISLVYILCFWVNTWDKFLQERTYFSVIKKEVRFARLTDLKAWTLSKAELRQAWWLSTLKPCRSTNMAAQEEWCFEEEGCLQFSGRPISVTFSPTSNCFICTLEDGTIEVVDARSSLGLKHTAPAGKLRSDEACV